MTMGDDQEFYDAVERVLWGLIVCAAVMWFVFG